MKTAGVIACCLGVIAVAGCGSGLQQCSKLLGSTGTGQCSTSGVPTVVVNRSQTVKLKTRSLTVGPISVTRALPQDVGANITAHGEFVVVMLTVRNTTKSAETDIRNTPYGMATLAVYPGSAPYLERFDAENGYRRSCLGLNDLYQPGSGSFKPGQSITCAVIFDLTARDAQRVNRAGLLGVTNVDEDLFPTSSPVTQLGIVRLGS